MGQKKVRMMPIEVKQEIIDKKNMSMAHEWLNWYGCMTAIHLQFAPSLTKRCHQKCINSERNYNFATIKEKYPRRDEEASAGVGEKERVGRR